MLTGGEFTVTLLLKPLVALHGVPATSNHVALKNVPDAVSHALLYCVPKPLLVAKSCAARTGLELGLSGAFSDACIVICLAAARTAKSTAFWALRLTR